MRKRVVLYNPKAEFYTMPLAVLSVGSFLDSKRYEVVIVDARLETSPLKKVLSLVGNAACLGVTVLTGPPIRDAVTLTRAVKERHPDLPIVWGGWHPSPFGKECLQGEPAVDVTVQGQGEESFGELLECFPDLGGVNGCAYRREDEIVLNQARPLRNINDFPTHNYEFIDVERHFQQKGRRQLDYISSQGCQFRCAFCADPSVYGRRWVGFTPERIGEEIEYLWKRYHFADLNFQDETFFTRNARVAAIAEEFLRRGIKITWAGTLRADQGARLSDEIFRKCRQSGLRRVMIGVESGSPHMLKWMTKDITIAQVFESAEKCLRHGVGAIFPFIVGFPEEPKESVDETLKMARSLRAMSPNFEIEMFFYLPYPGSPIADQMEKAGHLLPRTLEQWSTFDFIQSCGPWVEKKKRRRGNAFKYYQRLAWSRPSPLRWPVQKLAQWRCERLISC